MNAPSEASPRQGIRPIVWVLVLGVLVALVGGIVVFRHPGAASAHPTHGPLDEVPSRPTETGNRAAIDQVNATFQAYSKALLEDDGITAWSLIDFHTQNLYSQVLRDALSLGRSDLKRLDFAHKITVLRLRVEFTRPQLEVLNGRDVFVYAVTNQWFSRSTIQSFKALHHVTVDGRYAIGYLPTAPKVPVFHFIWEDDQWKLCLWRILEAANTEMQKRTKESGMSEENFIITLLREVSKYEVRPEIFDGPLE